MKRTGIEYHSRKSGARKIRKKERVEGFVWRSVTPLPFAKHLDSEACWRGSMQDQIDDRSRRENDFIGSFFADTPHPKKPELSGSSRGVGCTLQARKEVQWLALGDYFGPAWSREARIAAHVVTT